MMNLKIHLLAFICLLLLSCNDGGDAVKKDDSKKEISLITVELEDLNGEPIDVKQFEGKIVFINFWATWCKPCIVEMPSIEKVMSMLKEKNIIFLFASDESAEQIEAFRINNEFPFTYVRSVNSQSLNIMALPTTFIFNKEGKLIFNEEGSRNWDSKENIDLLLNIIK